MDFKNYLSLKKFSLRYKYYCFIDSPKYLADALFIKHKVKVWFLQEGRKEGEEYIFILCKIRKNDEEEFLNAMEKLKNKMIILGHTDYEEFCREIFEKVLENRETA